MKGWERFLWGLAGSFVAEVLRFYNQVQREHRPPEVTDLIFSACFLIIGGVFGIAWNERTKRSTLIIGITWPLLLASLLKTGQQQGSFLWGQGSIVYASEAQSIPGHKKDRISAASDPKTPPDRLKELALDPDEDVREALARRNPMAPELASLLANDPKDDVREKLAANPGTPVPTLRKLLGDPDSDVRKEAFKALDKKNQMSILERLRIHVRAY
jgi:hypothetical protein